MEERKKEIQKGRVGNLAWPAAGASIAIAFALRIVGGNEAPFVLASLGGSTVFLFALSETEPAQPRALFGGHLGGALIGILSYQIFGGALWVSVLAVALTMTYMVLTRTIHPPAGANPLLMVYNHAGLYELITPVGIGVLTLFLVALLWSRLFRGPRYPVKW
jgi:CBS-domain-containing membrane protein